MIAQDQIIHFKQELHKEIDRIFDLGENNPELIINKQDFSKKSEQFYKKYYKLCRTTNDILFENDYSIPLYQKDKYRRRADKDSDIYDAKIMPVLETINMLSAPGIPDYTEFSNSLSMSLKFLFTCYSFAYSVNLPKWVKNVDDIRELNHVSLQLKKLLSSFAEDIVICFRTANIDSQAKLPLTMLYCSELQDHVCCRIAEYLSAEDVAMEIAMKMIGKHGDKLDFNTVMDSMAEAKKITDDPSSERTQVAFQRLVKIMADLFISNLTSHLLTSPLKPKTLTTETRMKLLDTKNDLVKELEREFDRIK